MAADDGVVKTKVSGRTRLIGPKAAGKEAEPARPTERPAARVAARGRLDRLSREELARLDREGVRRRGGQ